MIYSVQHQKRLFMTLEKLAPGKLPPKKMNAIIDLFLGWENGLVVLKFLKMDM